MTTYDYSLTPEFPGYDVQLIYNNLESIASNARSSREFINSAVMKTRTILPGESHGGLIVSDTKKMDYRVEGTFDILVTIDGEEHLFKVDRTFK